MSAQGPADPGGSSDGDAPNGPFPDRDGDTAGSGSRKPVVIAVVAVATAAVVAGALLFSQQDEQPKARATSPAARGLACPYLEQAADAYDSGDHAAYEDAVAQAKDAAEGALQTSGQAFGKPERIALELGLATHPDVSGLLTKASEVCSTT